MNKKKIWFFKSSGWIFKFIFIILVLLTFLGVAVVALAYFKFSRDLPKIISIEDYKPPLVTRIIAKSKNEVLIGELFKTEKRYLVPYKNIPAHVVRAFLAAEDDRFFEHSGVNVVSMIRAAVANFRAGHVVQGGSTITQQVTKSLLLSSERSMVRKAKELILAYRIEKALSKEQILYLYLNQIYLGSGSYGIQAASKSYFRKDVSEITVAEAALLAGLPQAPGKYSPLLSSAKAKDRQRYVLRRMFETGYINQKQMSEAVSEPIRCYFDENINTKYSSYLVEHIRRILIEKYGESLVYEGGLTVYVPANPSLLRAGVKSLRQGLRMIDKREGYRGPIKKLPPELVDSFLNEYREELLRQILGYLLLMPDGKTDLSEAARLAGIQSEAQLLDRDSMQGSQSANEYRDDSYKAVVVEVDDSLKRVEVMIGKIKATLPFELMSWAHPVLSENSTRIVEIKIPSQVLKKGDVIEVRVVENTPRGVVVALEQTPAVQGALYSIEIQTGYIVAMEGGYDFAESEFNRAIQAQRQPGSSFKPFIYASALEKGYTPASVIVDSPIVYDSGDLGKWKPSNFEEKFYGDTTFRQALIKSRNIPTIKLVQSVQIPYLVDYCKRLGLQSQFNLDLSIALGSGAVSLQDITKTYALFPRLGRHLKPIFLLKVTDRFGRTLEEAKPQLVPDPIQIPPLDTPSIPSAMAAQITDDPLNPKPTPLGTPVPLRTAPILPHYPPQNDPDQLLDPRIAYIMTHLMKEVVTYGTGHEASRLKRPAAGKTGTTNDFIDAWFVGFTPQIVTGVWVGYDNRKPLGHGESGAKAALPIWLDFMTEAVVAFPPDDFTVPPGIVFASIDANSGQPVAPNSSRGIREAFLEGTEPVFAGKESTKQSNVPAPDFFKEDIE